MTTRPFERILSVDDLKTTADRLNNYFFTPEAMRFFNSRADWKLFPVDDSRGYFVTSERLGCYGSIYGPRLWTVRKYEVTRTTVDATVGRDRLKIDRAGVFQGFGSLEAARRRAEALQGFALIDPESFDVDQEDF